MQHAAAFFDGDLVGGDVEALVDLHFVGVDDFGEGEEEGGEVDGEARFSGAGGTHDDDHLVHARFAYGGGDGGGGEKGK